MVLEMDILDYFNETNEGFTFYVVEQRFAIGQGSDYFKSFRGKENMLDTNFKMQKTLGKILKWIQKKIPDIAELINSMNNIGVGDIVIILSKLFAVENHQAAGPNVIDPIIIQEGAVSSKYINQLINLHKNSILRPTIIIILKDNDFSRAKKELANCPNGCNIKFIRNSGECEIYKVVNSGANDVKSFLDAFSIQCYSTCSETPRNILLSEEWSNNKILNEYYPLLLKMRSNLLFDEKNEIKEDLDITINNLKSMHSSIDNEELLYRSFECMYDLQWVICNDTAGNKLNDALTLAKDIENEILLAHVYRYADLMPDIDLKTRLEYLSQAELIFRNNNIEDHAIYCNNNRLVSQFEHGDIKTKEFRSLQSDALNNVPGLCGMSHILNNVGVAYLMTGNPDEALYYFEKGIDYAKVQDRNVQKFALIINKLIARQYNNDNITDQEIIRIINQIFDNMGTNKLPFISARYIMNIIIISIKQCPLIINELFKRFQINTIIQKGLNSNVLGTGQIKLQLDYIKIHYNHYYKYFNIHMPPVVSSVSGSRKDFILLHGLNPFYFCTWL